MYRTIYKLDNNNNNINTVKSRPIDYLTDNLHDFLPSANPCKHQYKEMIKHTILINRN